jgi:uncharacterized protein YlxW (UPF0749 family)
MTRTFKLMTMGVFCAWLLTSTGCEDKVCQDALLSCKKDSTAQRKEAAAQMATISEIKSQLASAQAKVENLTKENEELKAKAEAADAKGKTKGKGRKAKHRKKGRK